MAFARNEYVGDGVTNKFQLNFALGYLNKSHVKCRVGGEINADGTPFFRPLTFDEDGLVTVGGATPLAGQKVFIFRDTPKDELLINYQDGAVFTQRNLDMSQLQSIMISHEALDNSGYDENGDGVDPGAGVSWNNITGKPSNLAGYGILDGVTDQELADYANDVNLALAGKASITQLAGKANSNHSHAVTDITGLKTFMDSKAQAGGLASLGADGKLLAAQAPNTATGFAVYNIGDFGVPENDPTGDHTAAFTALNTALANTNGGTVIIDRPCRIPNGWVLGTGNVHIRGTRTGKLISAMGPSIITLRARDIKNIRVSDLEFEKPAGGSRTTESMTIYMLNVSNVVIERCTTTNGLTGMWFDKSTYVWCVNNRIITPAADGIHFAVGTSDSFAIGNWIYGCDDDALACTMDYNPTHGKRITFANNIIEYTTWGAGIAIWETDQVLVSGNQISNTACAGIHISYFDEDGYQSGNSMDNIIINNKILNCALAQNYLGSTTAKPEMQQACGIYISKASRTTIKGNTITKIVSSAALVGSIGIGVDNLSATTAILDNNIEDIQGAGILCRGEVVELHVGGNHLFNVRGIAFDLKTQNPSLGDRIAIYDNNCLLCSGASGTFITVGATTISRGAQTYIIDNRALDSGSGGSIVVDVNANNPRVVARNYPFNPSGGGGGSDVTSGTWTPALRGSNGNAPTYTSSGSWRRIGDIVFFEMQWNITNVGGASGTLQCTNMPFARTIASGGHGTQNTSANGVSGLVANGGTNNPQLLNINRTDNIGSGSAIQVTSATSTLYGSFPVA